MAPILPVNDSELVKPIPREPKSPRHAAQIQTQNRRREYLARHDSYFDGIEHEFANPILYERLVKRFQTPAEREAERKTKGYGRTLEADLLRGESKLSNLARSNGNGASTNGVDQADTVLELEWDRSASSKEEGLQFWKAYLEDRFVKGDDEDFDYESVDMNEDLDTLVRKDAEDAWFDDEEPSWIAEDEAAGEEDSQARIQGETGVQDF